MIAETREMAYQFDRPYLFSSQKFEKAFFKPTPYKKAIADIAASEWRDPKADYSAWLFPPPVIRIPQKAT